MKSLQLHKYKFQSRDPCVCTLIVLNISPKKNTYDQLLVAGDYMVLEAVYHAVAVLS